MWFLYVELQTRRVPDTRLKPNGYVYGYEFLPVGTGTDINFYLQPLCWRAGNCSTRPEPDPLPSLCRSHPNSNLNIGFVAIGDDSPEFNSSGVWSNTSLGLELWIK
jgi:hypothetical protein